MGEAAHRLDYEERPQTQPRGGARVSVRVRIDSSSDSNFWTGLNQDVCAGGVFVATHHTLPVGSLVLLHLTVGRRAEEIVALAEVRWGRASGDDNALPPGLGMRFLALEAASVERIRRFFAVREPLFFDFE